MTSDNPKGHANYARLGSYNVICDTCGVKYKREDCRFKQESIGGANLLVCFNCWEPLHPYVIPLPNAIDMLPIPNARPRPKFQYVSLPLAFDGTIGQSYYLNGSFAPDFIIGSIDFILGGLDQQSNPWPNFPILP